MQATFSQECTYCFYIQNKKKKKQQLTWRRKEVDTDTESEIGQLMLYLVAAHFKRFSVKRHDPPVPILGLYMKDMKVGVNVYMYTMNV